MVVTCFAVISEVKLSYALDATLVSKRKSYLRSVCVLTVAENGELF